MPSTFNIDWLPKLVKTVSEHPAFVHITDNINENTVKSFLLASMPIFLSPWMTGVFAVDMFFTTTVSSLCLFTFSLLADLLVKFSFNKIDEGDLVVRIEPDYYSNNYKQENPYYTALVWYISTISSAKKCGSFRMKVSDNYLQNEELMSLLNLTENEAEDTCIEDFSVIPQAGQWIDVESDEFNWEICFEESSAPNKDGDGEIISATKVLPDLLIKQKDGSPTDSLEKVYTSLISISSKYLQKIKGKSERCRFKYRNNRWDTICSSILSAGFKSVALDEKQEDLLAKDVKTFINDRNFYTRLGIPYKRGYLLSGKHGTGKSSLINAMAAELDRDIYYINLRDYSNDSDLENAFSGIDQNAIIVMEDIDAQSSCVLDRRHRSKSEDSFSELLHSPTVAQKQGKGDDHIASLFEKISLSCLLNILDGHSLEPGTIVIMTSNHPEKLDPALIRPGRIDLHLSLGYCTHYQLLKMFKLVHPDSTESICMDNIPESVLSPCDAMRVFTLYRNDPIPILQEKLEARVREILAGHEVGGPLGFTLTLFQTGVTSFKLNLSHLALTVFSVPTGPLFPYAAVTDRIDEIALSAAMAGRARAAAMVENPVVVTKNSAKGTVNRVGNGVKVVNERVKTSKVFVSNSKNSRRESTLLTALCVRVLPSFQIETILNRGKPPSQMKLILLSYLTLTVLSMPPPRVRPSEKFKWAEFGNVVDKKAEKAGLAFRDYSAEFLNNPVRTTEKTAKGVVNRVRTGVKVVEERVKGSKPHFVDSWKSFGRGISSVFKGPKAASAEVERSAASAGFRAEVGGQAPNVFAGPSSQK